LHIYSFENHGVLTPKKFPEPNVQNKFYIVHSFLALHGGMKSVQKD